jgi:hypothetical protein
MSIVAKNKHASDLATGVLPPHYITTASWDSEAFHALGGGPITNRINTRSPSSATQPCNSLVRFIKEVCKGSSQPIYDTLMGK